jgi:glycosyltransferase involved in cell wall biosynthesis
MTNDRPDIAIFLYGPTSGGAPRRSLTLAGEFARRGLRVDLVFANPDGPLRHKVPTEVRQIVLGGLFSRVPALKRTKKVASRLAIPALGRYLRHVRPRVLFSGANSVHLSATLAHHLYGSDAKLALRVCTHLSGGTAKGLRPPRPLARRLARYYVPRADVVIAGSESVAEDLVAITGIERQRITCIYNPVVSDDLRNRSREELDHPWFRSADVPVVLAAGRIVAQKDYPTLVRAFAQLRAHRPAKLVILGEAKNEKRRQRLLDLAAELGVSDDVALTGLVDNPFAYMARAGVFALSSAWEGLPGVLIEAMACGCPVVSTDSPGGSREVLAGGRYGAIVPVGDATALAKALEEALDTTPDHEALRLRAEDFSVEAGVLKTLQTLGLAKESAA